MTYSRCCHVKFVKLLKIVLYQSNFCGEALFLLGIYDILKVFSTKLLRQLPRRRSIKTIIIWLTKQIKIPKIVETFSWKISMVEYCFHKFTGSHYQSRSPTLTIFLEKLLLLELQNTQHSLTTTRNRLLLTLRRFPSI